MSTESILGLESNSPDSAERAPSDSSVDQRLNTLRETVLQLLDEVESLAISRPVDIKRGARFSDEVRQFEVSLIRTALGRTSGSQTRAARLLGLKPTTLNAKIKRYGITEAIQRALNRPPDEPGVATLHDLGLQDLAFEALVIRHEASFSAAAVQLSKARVAAIG